MNTAVILNQSSFNGVFQTNEWKGGHPYPIFPSGYHLPIRNTLPLAGLKQLSLGKTLDNKWGSQHGFYPPQMVPFFNPTHTSLTPIKASIPNQVPDQIQRTTAQSLASTNIPQYTNTTAIQSITTTTAGNHVLQNAGRVRYLLPRPERQQSNTINVTKTPANRPTELSLPNATQINNSKAKTALEKQRNLVTRKRSSSWPTGSELYKKKPKDYKILEEYENLEMDVANILISDIPFPVVSLGSSEGRKASAPSEGRPELNGQTKRSPLENGRVVEAEQYANITLAASDEMLKPFTRGNISPLGSGEESDKHASSGEIPYPNGQRKMSPLGSGGIEKPGRQQNISYAGHGGMGGPANQANSYPEGHGSVGEPDKQSYMYSAGRGGMSEADKHANDSLSFGGHERVVGLMLQANMYPVGSGVMTEFNKQADSSPGGHGTIGESERPASNYPVVSGRIPEPDGKQNRWAGSGVGSDHEKTPSDGGTDSDGSSQFENEKENYSKNLMNPNKVVFTCQQCVVSFESTQDLISHTASHTSNNFTFKCNVCTQVFRSTNGLQKHVEFHKDHRNNFQCSFCFQPLADRDSLEEHIIASHMSRRPHKCSYCPKAFRDPGSLQKHTRIHTGERPYKCTACVKSFAEYSSLRKHYRVHTGEQPYQCQYCPKAFSISGNLQRHILIHTGERPYKCSECSKTFNNPSHLRRHEKNLHSKLECAEK